MTNNVIITGIPRSGTTLTCHLLNKLPDTIALHEPMKIMPKHESCHDYELLCGRVERFFEQTRRSLLHDGTAMSKHKNGLVPDNPIGNYPGLFRFLPNRFFGKRIFGRFVLRRFQVRKSRVTFDKPLSNAFTLCIKHNGGFATMLPHLLQRYPCYAVIRNPLSVLASWNSLKINLYDGHMHTVERMTPSLKHNLSQIDDRIERQFYILNWFFEIFHQNLPSTNIIRYETLVTSGGKALRVIKPQAETLNEPLSNKNRNRLYNRQLMGSLAEMLLSRNGAYWHFYSGEDIRKLL